jgi:hypothetical protein
MILRQSIAYLAQKESIIPEYLWMWCIEMNSILLDDPIKEESTIILYGFHTLCLKNRDKDAQEKKISCALKAWMAFLKTRHHLSFSKESMPAWNRGACFTNLVKFLFPLRNHISLTSNVILEIFAPESGFSPELRKLYDAAHHCRIESSV